MKFRRKRKFMRILIILGLTYSVFWKITSVNAEETGPRISVTPILPNNQKNNDVKYFDLRMKPGAHQSISINLKNHTNETIDLKISYADAKTTSQGVIEYSSNDELDLLAESDLLFTNLVSGPSEISLSPHQTKDVTVDIQMSDTLYDGDILGGIEFLEAIESQEESSSLSMQRSYLIGVKLSETDTVLPVDLKFDEVIVGLKHYKNAILVSLVNKNGKLVDELAVSIRVVKRKERTVVLESKQDNARVAPYSVFQIPIYLDDNLLDIGEYELHLQVSQAEGYENKWMQNFEITKQDRELFKEVQEMWGQNKKNSSKLFFFVILITIVTFFVAIGPYYLIKRKKREIK